ncbi:MAG: inositol monophosphatase [Calditrichales bacterium]|nr:MAG: inositol monophosphatase [Calditrichales bacterium]
MIKTAIHAALKGSEILRENFGKIRSQDIRQKSANDFLTFVDEKTEAKIIEIIHSEYPEHAIIAEESGKDKRQSAYEWIIDPLDGTKNYISGIPVFGISIALRYNGKMQLGVVLDPIRNDLFHAEHGKGAFLNRASIRVSERETLKGAFLATGFPFKYLAHMHQYMNSFEKIFEYASGVRRMGAAAIDLAYVAAGRFDGFWEIGLSPWDVAAGSILIREAGGKITDFWGADRYIDNTFTLASNGKFHTEFQNIVGKHFTDSTLIKSV